MVFNRSKKLKIICSLFILFAIALMSLGGVSVSSAQSDEEPQLASTSPATDAGNCSNPYLVRTFVDEEGREIDEIIVPGRPPEIKAAVATVPESNPATGINTLSNVPAFDWSYGCSATSAAMMMGYYDNTGYPNMYAGPTNGGLCPMDNSVWGQTWWVDEWYSECPLSATHQGVDGRATRGHVDDYWVDFGSTAPDPFIGNWSEHTHGECTGDFMGTNQYNLDNKDGGTTFFYYKNGDRLYDYTGCEPNERDGCHGLKLFIESRGYTVLTNFSQYIYGRAPLNPNNGFTFSDFCSEIDAGRPVLIHVEGHMMLGYGYNTVGQIVYIHNTWDRSDQQMIWGGTYGAANLQHYAATVLQLEPAVAPNNPPNMPSNPSPSNHATGVSVNTDLSWTGGDPDAGDTVTYDVYFGTSSTPPLVSNGQSGTMYDPGTLAYNTKYYWKVIATDNHAALTTGPIWDFTTQTPANNPPNTPSSPSPANHATGVSVNADLSWTGGDPDAGDTVTYDVYFGTSSTPPLVSNDQSGTTYDPGTLAYNTKYYWKVIATDNHAASTTGPLWDFTTAPTSNNPPQLSNPSVQPQSGTPSTGFYYYVNYYDSDGDSPSVKQVYIDGSAYTMSLYSGSASNGIYRYGPKNISVGWGHNYYFYFEDGKGGTARLPSSGGYSGPTIIEWDPWGYDGNRDGIIQKGEALQAIVDYFDTLITKTQVMEVLQLYFASV